MPAEGGPMKNQSLNLKRSALFALSFVLVFSTSAIAAAQSELVIYTYDSIVAKGGLGPAIFPLFEKQCGCHVKALASGGAGQLLARLQIDKARGKNVAHVVLGLDQNSWAQASEFVSPWGSWRPKRYELLTKEARSAFDDKTANAFLPYDFGIFAFIADTDTLKERKLAAPKTLTDLLRTEWRRLFILEDPRTSAPGLSFLGLTVSAKGEQGAWDFWRSLKGQWLTLAPGWNGAYSLFLHGEAPLVWSYTTSQAYHAEHGDKTGRYKAVLFDEGNPVQVEAAAIVKGLEREDKAAFELAKKFLEFLLSDEVQPLIPLNNWMFPSVKGVKLPASFKQIPMPKKSVTPVLDAERSRELLQEWNLAIEGKRR
jgi:thiamine transport system substrate-binding protein